MSRGKKNYGRMSLLFDIILTCLTGGLWLMVILIKYLRRNS